MPLSATVKLDRAALRDGSGTVMEPMSIEVARSVVLDVPLSVVRGHLISRWVDADNIGVADARVIHGPGGASAGRARDVLPAFHAVASRDDGGTARPQNQVFEVEAYKVMWRYELEALEPYRTGLHLVYVQGGFMARVPGIRRLMRKAMEREAARLQKWAASST
jgi:hypothetical protein